MLSFFMWLPVLGVSSLCEHLSPGHLLSVHYMCHTSDESLRSEGGRKGRYKHWIQKRIVKDVGINSQDLNRIPQSTAADSSR